MTRLRANPGAVFLLIGLVLISTGRALGNGFAFDDLPIILENAQVHAVSPPWVYALQSYWPPLDLGDAYRPWTVWCLALQWGLSDGAPLVFHLVNLLLTAAVTLAVFSLALELLPLVSAVAAAALFAVHPAHVEATANIVGQGELWMALFCILATLLYLRARREGPLGGRHRIPLAVLFVLAAASKEQGIVLPGLLALVEWLAIASRPGESRVREGLKTQLFLGVVGIGFLAGRYAVLGDLGGGPPAAGLAGLDLPERIRIMLPLVSDWARLLLWPHRLLAQYSPPAFGGPTTPAQAVLGAAILVAGAVLAAWGCRRVPTLALGLGWTALALLPVSNLLFPTGVLIAERTLLLPSAGLALSVGALLGLAAADRRARVAAALATGLLVAVGAARSYSRQAVWRDNPTLFAQTITDEPRSYRGLFVAGRDFVRRGMNSEAVEVFSQAATLYSQDHRVFEEWGQVLRAAGHCDQAIEIFARGVAADPTGTLARSRLFECLMVERRFSEAAQVAEEGITLGGTEFTKPLERARRALP